MVFISLYHRRLFFSIVRFYWTCAVFIRCTDTEEKNQRIIYDYGIPAEKAEAVSRRYNKKRSNYYYANTAQKWDDLRNYDIVLDSGKLGIDRCVEILKAVTDCEK